MRRRGFTLIEIVVVLAIVTIIAAMAVGLLSRSGARADLADSARELHSRIAQARQMAAGGQSGIASWVATDKVVNAGIQLISNTQYAVFIDRDNVTDGDEVVVTIVNVPADSLTIIAPAAPFEMRLRANGTLTSGAQTDFVMQNLKGQQKTVRVSISGTSRIL